jgi:FkbM family methyltransferase
MSVLSTCIDAYFEGKKIVFFGAGHYSVAAIKKIWPKIAYFCDNSPRKQGGTFWNAPIFQPDKLLGENRDETVVIINAEYYREIAEQLMNMGFFNIYSDMYERANVRITEAALDRPNFLQRKAEAISRCGAKEIRKLFADEQSRRTFDKLLDKYERGNFDFFDVCTRDALYFNDVFRADMRDDEVYVDGGAFDGATAVDFIFYVNGRYERIYAFEPDVTAYFSLDRELSDCRGVRVARAGLSDADGEVFFDARGTQSSKIVSPGQDTDRFTKINTVKLDTYVTEPVTFIKMDLEGWETKALSGARETIEEYRPKLAISVYHNDDDLVKIPLMLRDMVPEYKFYLLHHTEINVDTVLYAKI